MAQTDPARAKEIFLDALDLDAGERAAFLDERCDGDGTLRSRVDALLSAHAEAAEVLGDGSSTDLRGPAAAILDLSPGDLIGDYRLEEELGEGGFGRVFRAEQLRPVRRPVALKLLKLGTSSQLVMKRFETERQVLARMDHPHITRVLDAGATAEGCPFFVMELVVGEPITTYCAGRGLELSKRLELFRQVCLAIHHAHSKGILHRDIKPNNVLVTEVDGEAQPRVIDFGVAKAIESDGPDGVQLTVEGQLVGTPAFMSPEQFDSSVDVDTRSDVYSLGVLLYELVTGTQPFVPEGTGVAALVELQKRVRGEDPLPPSEAGVIPGGSPPEVDWICLHALECEPDRRYPTAFALAADVGRLLDGLPVEAAPASGTYRLRKLIGRHRAASLFAAAALLALVLGVAGTTVEMVRAARLNEALGEAVLAAQAEAEEARAQFDIAEAVNAFLTEDLLSAARPSIDEGRGHGVLMIDVLEAAASRIDEAAAPGGRFADAPRIEGRVRQAIGRTYGALGRDAEASRQLAPAVELLRVALGELHPETLRCIVDLGATRLGAGQYGEAEALLAEVIPKLEQVVGPADPTVLLALKLRAAAVRMEGRGEEASELYDEGLRVAREEGLEDSSAAAGILQGRAINEAELGNLDEAERLFEQVIEIRTRTDGWDAPTTLVDRANHAVLLLKAKRPDDAIELLEELVPAMRRVLGDAHPDTLVCMRNLVVVHLEEGRSTEVADLARAIHDVTLAKHGPDHPETFWTMDTLAFVMEAEGDVEGAVGLMRDLVERSDRRLGPNHPVSANRVANLGILLFRAGRFEAAEPVTWRALELNDAINGTEHHLSVAHLDRLADMRRAKGDDDEAQRLLEEALERVAQYSEATPQVLSVRWNLCRIHRDHERWDEALELLRTNLAELERVHGAGDDRCSAALSLMMDTNVRAGRLEEARALEARILPFLEEQEAAGGGDDVLRPPPGE
jgi:tetratricopeptide (TPR) repeat protein